MTPARRRRIFRALIISVLVIGGGAAAQLLLFESKIPLSERVAALFMGRRPGSAKAGTVLVRSLPPSAMGGKPLPAVLRPLPAEKDEGPVHLKFETLGGWKYIEGKTPIPDDVRAFNGRRVEITGFMMPVNETRNITRFIVVQSLWGCCFGQTPAVNHIVVVTMEPGKSVEFCPDLVRVVGRFSVGETREESYLVSIYRLEGQSVVVR